MRKGTKRALVIAIIGAAVWILSFGIGIAINITSMSNSSDIHSSFIPFMVTALIGGFGFLTAIVSGIICVLFNLQDRKISATK